MPKCDGGYPFGLHTKLGDNSGYGSLYTDMTRASIPNPGLSSNAWNYVELIYLARS
jgi:hypothetical protein